MSLKDYLFYLSGSNEALSKAEVLAVYEALGLENKVLHSYEQVLVVRAASLAEVPERLALCHGVYQFLGTCDPNMRDILSLARRVAPEIEDPVAVRVKRIGGRWKELRRDVVEREIGSALGKTVNLLNPKSRIVGFLTDRFLLGRQLLVATGKKSFHQRHPKTRPFFHPGVLLPQIARATVNLTRLKKGDRLIDPFCGTGGFLIEAGLMGATVYGCDINPRMIEGCRKNLEYYGITRFHLEVGDARDLNGKYPEHFDAIATDPPYGISASTRGLTLEELYMEVFPAFHGMLKKGGYACILSPDKIKTEEYAAKAGFTIKETYYDRVHAGLTRKILVVKK